MVSSTNVDAVAANNVALQHYGQKVVCGHLMTNSGKRILIQITFDVINVRKPLMSTSALEHRGVTIRFNHDYDHLIFRNETVNLTSHDCHSYLHIILTNGIPPCKALVMAGGSATNDVDEEVYDNDGNERNEAREASAGDRRAIAGQLDISGEVKTARSLRTPEAPTDAARMAHNATHVPFRDWCPICVSIRGSSPHRRVVVNKTADTLPKFQTDYMFIRTVAESKTQPCFIFVETRSGVVISFKCARKGGYEDLTKEILRHFDAYGFLNPKISQCEKEMSIIDVCRKVARERNARTVLRFAPKTSHQSNGLTKQCTDTYRDSHDATRHILRRTLAYNFQQFHCHTIFNLLRWICSLKIHSATMEEPHSKICLKLHVYHLCACLVNRYLLRFPITKCVQPN